MILHYFVDALRSLGLSADELVLHFPQPRNLRGETGPEPSGFGTRRLGGDLFLQRRIASEEDLTHMRRLASVDHVGSR